MKRLLLFYCLLLCATIAIAQNPGFENNFFGWNATTSPWSVTTTSGNMRSGARAALLTTSSTTDAVNQLTVGYSVTVPSTGTHYVTVVAWVRSLAPNNTLTAATVGAWNGTASAKGAETTNLPTTYTRVSHTFAATNGATYMAEIYGRSLTSGTAVSILYDDVHIYVHSAPTADISKPAAATRIQVTQSGTTLGYNWTAGTDAQTGVAGTLILRANGLLTTSVTVLDGTLYSTQASAGPATIGSFTVVANGSDLSSFSQPVTNNTAYTYVVVTRDHALNYATTARLFVFNGTGLSATAGTNTTLDGFHFPAGNTLTISSPSTVSLRTSTINIAGTVINQGNLNNSSATLTFSSGSLYNYNRNNSGSFSIPNATWAPGSLCRITGVTTTGPGGTAQTFADFEWASTSQTGAFTFAPGFGTTGNFIVNGTGTGSISFPAATTNSIGGNFVQSSGTVSFQPGHVLLFNGSAAQQIGAVGPLQGLTLQNPAGLTLRNTFTINQALNLTSGTLHNSAFALTMADGSTITRSGGTVAAAPLFAGTVNVTYLAGITTGEELPSGQNTLARLTIAPATGTVSLSRPVRINTGLDFTLGHLKLGNHDLSLAETAMISGNTSSKYIITDGSGRMGQEGMGTGGQTGAVLFPVGVSASSYTPATLSNSGSRDVIYLRVIPQVYQSYDAAGSPNGPALATAAVERSWIISEGTAGGSDLMVTLSWEAANEINGFNRTYSQVAFYEADKFNNDKGTAATGEGPYMQSRSGLSKAGAFTVQEAATALPVEWLHFTARAEGSAVVLQWATGAESSNDRFEVERAGAEGRNFTAIGQLAGRGDTNWRQDYRFADTAPLPGTAYYRLRQVDHDGTYSYSRVVRVDGGEPELVRLHTFTGNRLTLEAQAGELLIASPDGRVLYRSVLTENGRLEVQIAEPVVVVLLHDGDRQQVIRAGQL